MIKKSKNKKQRKEGAVDKLLIVGAIGLFLVRLHKV